MLLLKDWSQQTRAGRSPGAVPVRREIVTRAAVDEKKRTATFTASDGSVDRHGDTINPLGWRLADYMRNPVILWVHQSKELPVGRALRVWIEKQALKVTVEFTAPELYQFGDQVFKMVAAGYLNAVSVGFVPELWDWSDDSTRPAGIDIIEQSLLEISVVPVPAHPGALVDGRTAGPAVTRSARERWRALQGIWVSREMTGRSGGGGLQNPARRRTGRRA